MELTTTVLVLPWEVRAPTGRPAVRASGTWLETAEGLLSLLQEAYSKGSLTVVETWLKAMEPQKIEKRSERRGEDVRGSLSTACCVYQSLNMHSVCMCVTVYVCVSVRDHVYVYI